MNRIKVSSLAKAAAGLLICGGLLYIAIQLIHPIDQLSSVGTSLWAITAVITSLMSLFIFLGILSSYLLQAHKAGWLGLLGFSLFGFFWLISMTFSFNEAFVWPLLVHAAPEFVSGMVGLFGGAASAADLGLFPSLAAVSGIMYMLGGLLYAIATLRAKLLSKYPAIVLAVAALATLATALVPHPLDRLFAVPMAVALIWLGLSSWRLAARSVVSA